MNRRHSGTSLATFTLAVLVLYAPIETWYSLPALWDPFYLVDFIGMVLLIWGAVRLHRDTSSPQVGLLIAGYAWTGANVWRALFGRLAEVADGGALEYGWAELCFTACVLSAAFAGLVWALVLSSNRLAPPGATIEDH